MPAIWLTHRYESARRNAFVSAIVLKRNIEIVRISLRRQRRLFVGFIAVLREQ